MSRRYGPIGTAVWESEKFLNLASDSNRLGYLYLIACPHGNSVGVFQLKPTYFAADRRLTDDEDSTAAAKAEAMLADIERVGLIRRGGDNQVRVVNWFNNETGANSPSTASSFCKVFKDKRLVKPSRLRTEAIIEMVYATLEKAEGWNPDSKPWGQMVNDIQVFMQAELRADSAGVIEAMRRHQIPEKNTTLHMVLDTVFNMVLGHGVIPTLTHEHGNGQRETETETDTGHGQRTTDNGQRGDLQPDRRKAPCAPPSLPAKSGQSGRGKVVDPETQAKLDSLNRNSKSTR